jgi:O-antigen/teichoic acid export membrane protein
MGLSAAFVLAIERVDIWVLDVMRGPEEVGVYAAGAAFRPAFLAQAVVWAMLPLAFRLGRDNRDALARAVTNCGRFLLVAGTGIAIFFAAGAPMLMPLLGGEQYAASVPVFELMGLALPFTFVSFLYLHALTAVDRQMAAAGIFAGGLAVNLVLDLVLVPALGATGAMLATLTAEAAMAAAALAATWRLVGRPVAARDVRILAAAVGAAGVALAARAIGLGDAGLAATAAFAILLVSLKAVTRQDLALLHRSFGRQR